MDYIQFADNNVKQILLRNGVGSNGEISYEEAASVTNIGRWFREDISITTFDELQFFTNLKTIANGAFYACKNLRSIVLPQSIAYIAPGAFQMTALESFTVPVGVFVIEESTFSHCYSLSSVTLPHGLNTIGNGAFFRCRALSEINIPDTVTVVGASAFRYSGIQTITIPSGVTCIDMSTFRGCESLTSVSLPDGLVTIETGAFFGCKNLGAISIPNGVTEIKAFTFHGCAGLRSITVPDTATIVEQGAFLKCTGLEHVYLPSGLEVIEDRCFEDCRSLGKITIPSNTHLLGKSVFKNCIHLSEMVFKGVTPPSVVMPDILVEGVPTPITVYVPSNAVNAYRTTPPFDTDKFNINGTVIVSTPSFSPSEGITDIGTPIELSSDDGATIYYTLDGSTPNPYSYQYNTPIVADTNLIIKAYATRDGAIDSDVATGRFSVKMLKPVITPPNGIITDYITVTITADPEFTIRYTIDGTTPNESSPIYTNPLVVSNPCLIKAIVTGDGYIPSDVVTAMFSKASD